MEDKEVGKLWQIYKTMEHDPVHKLIRKLVEERARLACGGEPDNRDYQLAVRDFGIDPETWPKT